MVKKRVVEEESHKNRKLFAWLATFLTIIGFIVALLFRRDDEYVMYYAKQGLILFIGQVIVGAVSTTPFIGKLFFSPILWAIWFVFWFITWINALSGKKKATWLVQDFAEKIKV